MAQPEPALLRPRLEVPSVALSPQAFVPPGAEVLQRVRLPASASQPGTLADVWLLRQGERCALLLGTRTGQGQFEAWEWATFMNCLLCRDDPTSSWGVRLNTRGVVLTVHGKTASVTEPTGHEATWRLRGLLHRRRRRPAVRTRSSWPRRGLGRHLDEGRHFPRAASQRRIIAISDSWALITASAS